ncbi:hypothetical protein CVT24_009309 [Panaeolus cyanescens]|uniref:Uncharacterized protein n=1 Tax=Panaeolus cyanescens TaxID=181874 RepID=A0A409Y8K5_9AGAR|nr:hypothetical protein CVT24_009309 [Panaeolus cyanescens]
MADFSVACEGDCISGIAQAIIGNYSAPVHIALTEIADNITSTLIRKDSTSTPSIALLNPIIDAFNNRIYDDIVQGVFREYFHGKCQDPDTSIDPPGCPNPDCPTVCGTPGSIVHHFPKFRYLAYRTTVNSFNRVIKPDSSAYRSVEDEVLREKFGSQYDRRFSLAHRRWQIRRGLTKRWSSEQRETVRDVLQEMLGQFRWVLLVICGGSADGKTNGLPECSWEEDFKNYILTFP